MKIFRGIAACVVLVAAICVAFRHTNQASQEPICDDVPPPIVSVDFHGQPLGKPGVADFVLWGDSHAMAVVKMFDEVAKAKGVSGQAFVAPGIPPLLGTFVSRQPNHQGALDWEQRVVDWINDNEVLHIFIVGRWEIRTPVSMPKAVGDDGDMMANDFRSRMIQDPKSKEISPADSRRVFDEGLARTLKALEGRHVYFVMQPPLREDVEGAYALEQSNVMRSLVAQHSPLLHVLGPGKWFPLEERAYVDRDHVSAYGANKMIRPLVEPVFDDIQ